MVDGIVRIGIVIPVHNRRETTLQCLRSLGRVNTEGCLIKIFVVDDGSSDGTSEAIAREFPDVDLIRGDGTLHYAAGTNRGISAAIRWNVDYVLCMNDDTVFHEQFLQRMLHTARSRPHSVIGALLLLWDKPHEVFQIGQVWNTRKGGWIFPPGLTAFNVPSESFEVECIVGNCVLFPIEAIRECGLMDEKHFPHGWGDAQYLVRMRKKGWNLFVEPRALVWCEPNTYPSPLHEVPVKERLAALFVKQRHPQNLKRQFVARWYSAPTRTKAVAAYAIYCVQLLQKAFHYGIGAGADRR